MQEPQRSDWKKAGPCLYRYLDPGVYAPLKQAQIRRSLETQDHGSKVGNINGLGTKGSHLEFLGWEEGWELGRGAGGRPYNECRRSELVGSRKVSHSSVEHAIATSVTTMPTMTINRPAGSPCVLPEHARVRLLHDFPDDCLKVGATGTIVFVYEGGADYEVEFLEGKKRPVVLTVEVGDIALLEE